MKKVTIIFFFLFSLFFLFFTVWGQEINSGGTGQTLTGESWNFYQSNDIEDDNGDNKNIGGEENIGTGIQINLNSNGEYQTQTGISTSGTNINTIDTNNTKTNTGSSILQDFSSGTQIFSGTGNMGTGDNGYGSGSDRGIFGETNTGDNYLNTGNIVQNQENTYQENNDLGNSNNGFFENTHEQNEQSQSNNGEEENILGNSLRIYEIYPKDSKNASGDFILKEYIVIEALQDYQGTVSILGLGGGGHLGGAKEVNINLFAGEFLIVTDGMAQLDQSQNIFLLPSITLTDGGEELQIKDEQGNILDDVLYAGGAEHQKSFYYTETLDDIRQFTTKNTYSVLLSGPMSPICELEIQDVSQVEDTFSYTLILTGIDDFYCSSWYKRKRGHDGGEIVGETCTQTFVTSGGFHTLSVELSQGDTILCDVPLYIYNYQGEETCSGTGTSNGTGDNNGNGGGTGDNQTGTGNNGNGTGNIFSGEISGFLQVTEIHPYDTEQFPEYIELLALQDINEELSFQGLGHGKASKEFLLQLYSGERIIITDSATGFSQHTKIQVLSSISLTDGGETLTGFRQNGQVIDTYLYGDAVKGKSLIQSGIGSGVLQFFDTEIPTPGLDYTQIAYLFDSGEEQDIFDCSIHIQNNSPYFAGNKINLITTVNGKEIQNSSSHYSCVRNFPGSDYIFTGGCNPSYYDYTSAGVYEVSVSITNDEGKTCSSTIDINYPEKSSGGGGNSGAGSSCRQSYYEGLYHKRKDRYTILKKDVSTLGYGVTTSGNVYEKGSSTNNQDLGFSGGIVKILGLLPNPKGSDKEHEKIILQNMSSETVFFDDMYTFNGTSKKRFPEGQSLVAHMTGEIVGSLGLTNRPTCLSLQDTEHLYDTFCYPKAGDDEWFRESLNLSGTQEEDGLDVLGKLKIVLDKTKACIEYNKEYIMCKDFKYSDEDIKQRKAQAKKFLSIEKKLTKFQEKRKTKEGKLEDQLQEEKKKRTKDKKRYTKNLEKEKAKTKKQKSLTTRYQKQTRLHQGFITLVMDELQKNWLPVYKQSVLSQYHQIYKQLNNKLKQHQYSASSAGIDFSTEDIFSTVEVELRAELPLEQVDLGAVYPKLFEDSEVHIETFLNNLQSS